MSGFIEGISGEDNPVRIVDVFVDALGLVRRSWRTGSARTIQFVSLMFSWTRWALSNADLNALPQHEPGDPAMSQRCF